MTKTKNAAISVKSTQEKQDDSVKEIFHKIPRGRPVSGRLWKTERVVRHSEIKRDKCLSSTWEQKMQEKQYKKECKVHETELKEARAKVLQDKRHRAALNRARHLENQKKAETVQTVKNAAKLKRTKKKKLKRMKRITK